MDIVQHPDKVLSTVSSRVEPQEARKLANKMLKAYGSLPQTKVGLAAPQIGINKNMAIVLGEVMMNLDFTPARAYDTETEACFSIDFAQTPFKVKRPRYGWARWETIDGLPREEKLNGFKVRVFQHELDHIKGRLCHQAP